MLSYGLERKGFYDDKNVNFVKFKNSKIFSNSFFSEIGLEIMLNSGLDRN